MKRLLCAGLVVALLVCAAPAMAAELLAGQEIYVGDVTAVLDGDMLHVTYDTVDNWAMTETHLAVGKVVGDTCVGIPMTKKGNPIPGQFPYGSPYDPPATSDTFDVDVSGLCSVVGTWDFTYYFGGPWYHTMVIDDYNPLTGDFSGTGYWNGGPITWTIEGNTDGDSIEFTIDYDGSAYYIEAEGTPGCSYMSGDAAAPDQTATWEATRVSGGGLCVAAHASVVHITEGCDYAVSDASTKVVDSYAGGQLVPGSVKNFVSYPFDAVPAWEPSADATPSYWDNALSPNYFTPEVGVPLADWIWESYRVQHPVEGDVVDFERKFSIPGMYLLSSSGHIHITCDNGYQAKMNGALLGRAQLGIGDAWRSSNLIESFVFTNGWQTVETFNFPDLQVGVNTLRIETANEYMGTLDNQGLGTIISNPGGLIYEAQYCYEVIDQEETGWGDGPGFPGANWATYFVFTENPAD